MKISIRVLVILLFVWQAAPAQTADVAWPHPFPARIHDGGNREVMVMTLGDVKTTLADGTFDPAKDEMTLKNGSVTRNYYKDTLGIKFFQPIDKSKFPLPPAGWCS